MTEVLPIVFEYFDDHDLPPEHRMIAYINDPKYKGFVVAGATKADCLKELGKSLHVLDLYNKSKLKP